MSEVGEIRESDYIDCRNWDFKFIRVWRKKNDWRIEIRGHGSDGSIEVKHLLEYYTWDATKWSAEWRANEFFHTPADASPGHPDRILNYIGHVPAEKWECFWDAKKALFIHTLKFVSAHQL